MTSTILCKRCNKEYANKFTYSRHLTLNRCIPFMDTIPIHSLEDYNYTETLNCNQIDISTSSPSHICTNINTNSDKVIQDNISEYMNVTEDHNMIYDTSTLSNSKEMEDELPLNKLESRALKFFVDHSIPISHFDEFVELFTLCSNENLQFKDKTKQKIYSRLINKLKQQECMARHQFEMISMNFSNETINIPRFPFISNIQWLLLHPDLMKDPLLHYNQQSTTYNEMNTGEWWYRAESTVRAEVNLIQNDHDTHLLIPLLFFIDKSHVSSNGKLKAEPVLCSIGNIPFEKRKTKQAWFNIGFIPTQSNDNSSTSSPDQPDFYQRALDVLLKEVRQCCNEKNGILMSIHGHNKLFRCHFEVSAILGDMVGHDTLCCHFQSYGSPILRPYRSCYVDDENLVNPSHKCQLVKAEDIFNTIKTSIRIKNSKQRGCIGRSLNICKDISQKQVIPAFAKFRFGGCEGGVFQCTPPETLHAILKGPIESTLDCLFNYSILHTTIQTINDCKDKQISNKRSRKLTEISNSSSENIETENTKISTSTLRNIFWKSEFNNHIQQLSKQYNKQSDTNLPRAIFNTDVTELSNFSAQEYIGLSILAIIALPGCIQIDDNKSREKIESDFSDLLWKGVSIYYGVQQYEISKMAINELDTKIRCYLEMYNKVCGEQRKLRSPSVGLKLRKNHSLLHIVPSIKEFGSSHNFFGGYLELMLKTFVKMPGKRTRNHHGNSF